MELIVCARFLDVPKKNLRAYVGKSLEEVLKKHAETRGLPAQKVYQWGGAFYVDVDVEEEKHE